MRLWPTGQEAEPQRTTWTTTHNFRQHRRSLIVAHYQIVSHLGIHGNSGVAKMAVHDTRLILLVIVHPQLD